MERAKAFFLVCSGLLLIALAYHVGAQTVAAQPGDQYVSGSFDPDTDPLVIDASGQMWLLGWANSRGVRVGPIALPKSGTVLEATGAVVAGTFEAWVIYTDGDAYHFDRTSWVFVGNVAGGATPTVRESWGAVKQRYR